MLPIFSAPRFFVIFTKKLARLSRALAMVKNLAAQLLGIGVEVVGAESVLREAFASAGTLLRRPDMNAEFAAVAIFWIAERPGYPR